MADEAPEAVDPMAVDLSGVCPDPLVLQTDWFPSPEHGYAYYLIGDAGTLDPQNGIFRGPLLNTGIDLEIRAGGPYLGFQPMTDHHAARRRDPPRLRQHRRAGRRVRRQVPTIAVAAPFEINPQILMWNPDEFSFSSFEDIGQSGAAVVYFARRLCTSTTWSTPAS